MVLSLSPGPAPLELSWHLRQYANMWRITDDFWDDWPLLREMFSRCEVWEGVGRPGCWPDCDILPLGKLRIGFHDSGLTPLTREEQRTMMTLWSIFRSPLMMGSEMRSNDAWTLALLTNGRVLRLLRHSSGASQLMRSATQAAWHSFDDDGSEYLALFNLSDTQRTVAAEGFSRPPVQFSELWGRDALLRSSTSADIPAHGMALIRAEF